MLYLSVPDVLFRKRVFVQRVLISISARYFGLHALVLVHKKQKSRFRDECVGDRQTEELTEPQRRTDRHCIEPSRENAGSKRQNKTGFRVFERNNIQGNIGQHAFISQHFRKNRILAIKREITRGREFYRELFFFLKCT